MHNTQTAISTLFHAIENKTENEVNKLCALDTEVYNRTIELRKLFMQEQAAQRALTRALKVVDSYTENKF